MADNDTLLGYLVPRYANVTENAATDALAYIMNRSAACMQSLNELVQPPGGAAMQPVTRVETQVSAPFGSIPDFVGFDDNGDKRIVGESKFGAGLGEGQAGVYLKLLPDTGPAVLLFVVPAMRIDRLWAAVTADAKKYGWEVDAERIHTDGDDGATRRSAVAKGHEECPGNERRLMMVSWGDLLTRMKSSAAREPGIVADIDQLLGLTRREDAEAFLPLSPEELGPAFPRRMQGMNRLIDEVTELGKTKGWINKEGVLSVPQWHGHGRQFRFTGVEGDYTTVFLGVHFWLWVDEVDTPLWLRFGQGFTGGMLAQVGAEVYRFWSDQWTPIYLKTGLEYHELLDDVESQLKAIGEQLKQLKPAAAGP